MGRPKALFHEEDIILTEFQDKVKSKKISLGDTAKFCLCYDNLLKQSKVVTKVSDRLQKKLDQANQKIKSQSKDIQQKNTELESTVEQLIHMTVGKKAFRIMFMVAIVLFISEEYYLEPIIEDHVEIPFLSLGIKIVMAIFLRIFEGWLEGHFLNEKMSEVLGEEEFKEKVIRPKMEKLRKVTSFE